jgi:HK97 family phage portal protein
MVRWGYNELRNIPGTGVTAGAVAGIPAINRAVRIRAEAIASLRLCCWRGYGGDRELVETVWQAGLFEAQRANEYQTRFDFWDTAEESLCYRGNAYIWKNVDPASGRIVEWYALHPDQVACTGYGEYQVKVARGYIDPVGQGEARYEVGDDTILHIRGHGDGGTLEAPSPIKVFRDALQSPISRQRYENSVWEKGTAVKLAVQFPAGVTQQQAEEWKAGWKQNYEGASGDRTAVIGGGAVLTPIGMTNEDAQFVDMAHLTAEDASRIIGVPARLLGILVEKNVPLEQDLAEWLRFGLGPELFRIESALAADEQLFGQARTYPGFNTEDFVRGDLLTEDNVAHQRVQDGRLLVDEWRKQQGWPPLPNGAGMVPQIVPVGGGANPMPQPAPLPPDDSGN